MSDITIRPYRLDDVPQINYIEATVQPYLPEHRHVLPAMYERALSAMRVGDYRWVSMGGPTPGPEKETHLAFWVAEAAGGQLVGTVGAYPVRLDHTMPLGMGLVQEWRSRHDVALLDRLRVMPEARRQRVAWRLNEAVIEWCRTHGYRTLVLNTTPPQIPAVALYRSMGFREEFHSFVGRYELIWFVLDL